jgi:hypothetical protein
VEDRPALKCEIDEKEIDVTDEMIKAGAEELRLSFNTDGNMDDPEITVLDVFLAMMRASKIQA